MSNRLLPASWTVTKGPEFFMRASAVPVPGRCRLQRWLRDQGWFTSNFPDHNDIAELSQFRSACLVSRFPSVFAILNSHLRMSLSTVPTRDCDW
jgi:hypothetical protein